MIGFEFSLSVTNLGLWSPLEHRQSRHILCNLCTNDTLLNTYY
jgi:hypothetical protein